jgi:hypothetical protein
MVHAVIAVADDALRVSQADTVFVLRVVSAEAVYIILRTLILN